MCLLMMSDTQSRNVMAKYSNSSSNYTYVSSSNSSGNNSGNYNGSGYNSSFNGISTYGSPNSGGICVSGGTISGVYH